MRPNLDEISARLLSDTSTGFSRHADGSSYHGFTCPTCGSHYFGTHSLPNGTSVGKCHAHQHTGNGCTFSWDRTNASDEGNVMHYLSYDEWLKSTGTQF
jgi:hypothetical protein